MKTAFYEMHLAAKAKMVDFAGYLMPLHYEAGILKEHLHTRNATGLFDVSHMGQFRLYDATKALSKFLPTNLETLGVHHSKYSFLMNDQGGIEDDLIVTKLSDQGDYFLVVNASRKEHDFGILSKHMRCEEIKDRALLALQGPDVVRILSQIIPGVEALKFMQFGAFGDFWVTRSGYTGEDGFEISLPETQAENFAQKLLANPQTMWVGLGARDSLRLEAGLSLYGHELDTTTSPLQADLGWAVTKLRDDYQGASLVLKERETHPHRIRVGIQPLGRIPAREHTKIYNENAQEIGEVTSGGFSPSLQKPIAMGYVAWGHHAIGTRVKLSIRDQFHEAEISALPFVPHRYYRGEK